MLIVLTEAPFSLLPILLEIRDHKLCVMVTLTFLILD